MKIPRRNYNADEKEDRLSDLPDSVVLHILSFLKAKQIVQTSVLSTRWYNLWKYLPTLKLVCSHLNNFDNFLRFVIAIFYYRCRDPSFSLHELDIDHEDGVKSRHNEEGLSLRLFNGILDYAVSRNVNKLRIFIRCDIQLFPSCISSCRNLKSLNFVVPPRNRRNRRNSNGKILFPNSLNLPSLTSLYLGYVSFGDGVDHFSSFPRLSELTISAFEILGERNFNISSTTLTVLTMKKSCYPWQVWKIQLSTPNLTTLYFGGSPFHILCGSRLNSLKHVEIFLELEKMNYAESPYLILSLLQQLADIKWLVLYSTTLHVLSLVPDVFKVKLNSLRKLKWLRILVKEMPKTLVEAKLAQQPARSQKEIANLRQAFNKGSCSVPSEIIEFLLQNSPSAKLESFVRFKMVKVAKVCQHGIGDEEVDAESTLNLCCTNTSYTYTCDYGLVY